MVGRHVCLRTSTQQSALSIEPLRLLANCMMRPWAECLTTMATNSNLGKNSRLYLLGAMLLFWCVAICVRLVYLQIFRYGSFVKQTQHQQQRGFDVSANRGLFC